MDKNCLFKMSVSSIIDRFRASAKRQGIHPLELFEEYDHRKIGLLNPTLFIRAIVSTGFHLTAEESQQLCEHYNHGGSISYRRFLSDLANPQTSVLPEKTDQTYPDLLEFGLKLQSKNLTLIDVILEYDRMRNGRVSVDNFYRAFGSSELIKRIAKQYTNLYAHDIDYMQLQSDVQNALKNRSQLIHLPKAELPDFFTNFVKCLSSRNAQLHETFIDYDRFKRGSIAKHDFLAVLTSFGIPLSAEQLYQLMTPFLQPNGNDVDYQSFLTSVNQAKATIDASRTMTTRTIPQKTIDPQIVINDIKTRIELRRISLRPQFESAISESGGQITRQRFYKLLNFCGFSLTNDEMTALDSIYMNHNGIIDVESFLQQVDQKPQVSVPIDLGELLSRLRSHLLQRQTSIIKHFVVFDREDSGIISVNQLISVLQAIDFHPTTNELNAIINRFGDGKNIHWKEISNIVEPIIEKRDFSKSITANSMQLSAQRPTPSPEAISFMKKIHKAAKACGANVRMDLVRLDIRKCGLINGRLLRDELQSLPFKFSIAEFNTVSKIYFKPNSEMLNYPDFCDDLEVYGPEEVTVAIEPTEPLRQTNFLDTQVEKNKESLQMLKAALHCHRLTVDDIFYIYDSRNTGLIPIEVVIPAFERASILLTNQQKDDILAEFRDKRQPEKYNYKHLSYALKQVVPSKQQLNIISERQRQIAGENDGVHFITNVLKNKLAERKKTIYDLFMNVYDDYISTESFRNRFTNAGIIISEADLQKLIRKYKGNGDNQIAWKPLCVDVEESQPIQYTSKS